MKLTVFWFAIITVFWLILYTAASYVGAAAEQGALR